LDLITFKYLLAPKQTPKEQLQNQDFKRGAGPRDKKDREVTNASKVGPISARAAN